MCVAYEIDGVRHDEMPMTQTEFHHAKPVYEYFEGWQSDISGASTVSDLPQEAIDYLNFIVRQVRVPIALVSVGPQRQHQDERPV